MTARARNWIIRLTVSALVLAALLRVVPLHELGAAVRSVSPWLWLTIVPTFLLGHAASAFKWRLLLPDRGIGPRLWLTAHFAGLTANLALPGLALPHLAPWFIFSVSGDSSMDYCNADTRRVSSSARAAPRHAHTAHTSTRPA